MKGGEAQPGHGADAADGPSCGSVRRRRQRPLPAFAVASRHGAEARSTPPRPASPAASRGQGGSFDAGLEPGTCMTQAGPCMTRSYEPLRARRDSAHRGRGGAVATAPPGAAARGGRWMPDRAATLVGPDAQRGRLGLIDGDALGWRWLAQPAGMKTPARSAIRWTFPPLLRMRTPSPPTLTMARLARVAPRATLRLLTSGTAEALAG